MPPPGSHRYKTLRARWKKHLENEGIPGRQAVRRARAVLQGRIPPPGADPHRHRNPH
jgi:hypothetical protein